MRRIALKAVLHKAETVVHATRTEAGDSNGLARVDLLTGLVHVDTWATLLWESFFWPEWTIVERRTFRAPWASATAYSAPSATAAVEVFHIRSGRYAQALQASTGQEPFNSSDVENSAYWALSASSYTPDYDFASGLVLTVGKKVRNLDDGRIYQCHTAHTTTATFDGTKFGILTPFKRTLAKEQSWETNAIDAVKRIYEEDPEVNPAAPWFDFLEIGDNYIPAGDANVIYVRFRKRVPATGWRATIYSATVTYAEDDIAYFDTPGDVYVSLAGNNLNNPYTDTTKWARVDFPHVLRDGVALGVAAAWLKADGELELAGQTRREAETAAGLEFEKVERQQGQSGRIPMRIAI